MGCKGKNQKRYIPVEISNRSSIGIGENLPCYDSESPFFDYYQSIGIVKSFKLIAVARAICPGFHVTVLD